MNERICEHCGSTDIVDNCHRCGAPQCCDRCCRETTKEINLSYIPSKPTGVAESTAFLHELNQAVKAAGDGFHMELEPYSAEDIRVMREDSLRFWEEQDKRDQAKQDLADENEGLEL